MYIRKYKTSDCDKMAGLFYNTVHSVNAKDYSDKQLEAWADGNVDLREWDRSFLQHTTLVSIENDEIVGFGDIDSSGYLDRLYVHKDYQGKGAATAICDELERAVQGRNITTHASITARTFFEHMGYVVIRQQEVIRRGIRLTNFVVEKKTSGNVSADNT